jgi:hypothetical protein
LEDCGRVFLAHSQKETSRVRDKDFQSGA